MNTEKNNHVRMNKNRLVEVLGKPQKEFTRDDIIDFIGREGIEMVNFMYAAGDGRLKTLNFVINDCDYLATILSQGERVDGSSLFSYIDPANSDLMLLHSLEKSSKKLKKTCKKVLTLKTGCGIIYKSTRYGNKT